MSEEKLDLIYNVRMSIDDLDGRLKPLENNFKSWKDKINENDKGLTELNDIFENMCNDIDERLNKIETKLENPFMLSGNKALKINGLIEKLEQKIINEDYSDLLLLIKKIKEMLK